MPLAGLYSRRMAARANGSLHWKELDKNILSAMISILVIVLVSAALSQPQWFWLEGGGCDTHTLGLYPFLHPGHFRAVEGEHLLPSSPHLLYYTNDKELKFCVTPNIVALLRIVIGMCFVILWSMVVQLLLDITGPSSSVLTLVRKSAIPSIFSVLVCVAAIGLCYYISTLIEHQQEATKPLVGPNALATVKVRFDVGFYLLLSGGGFSVGAVAANWLRLHHIFQDVDTAPLVEEMEGTLSHHGVPGPLPGLAHLHDIEPPPPLEGHPPPPYTP